VRTCHVQPTSEIYIYWPHAWYLRVDSSAVCGFLYCLKVTLWAINWWLLRRFAALWYRVLQIPCNT